MAESHHRAGPTLMGSAFEGTAAPTSSHIGKDNNRGVVVPQSFGKRILLEPVKGKSVTQSSLINQDGSLRGCYA